MCVQTTNDVALLTTPLVLRLQELIGSDVRKRQSSAAFVVGLDRKRANILTSLPRPT